MTIIRPPVTGDPQLDSWAHSVTDTILRDSSTVSELIDSNAAGTNNSVNAVTLILYKRYESETLPLSEYIQTTLKYTYKTSSLDITNPDGWSREYPDVNQGRVVFAIQVNIADTNEVEIIPASAWSEPIVVSRIEDAINVFISSSTGGTVFKNSIGTAKELSLVVTNSKDGTTLTPTSYQWFKNGVQVRVTSETVRTVVQTGGEAADGAAYSTIIVGPGDVTDNSSEEFSCIVTVPD